MNPIEVTKMIIAGVHMKYDAIIVGGGVAGLTAAAYLAKSGHSTLICEKEETCGGLVSTFERDGFFYDGGIRAMENSGVVFPMVKQLGLDIDFIKNHITMGIEDQVIRIESEGSVKDYQSLLIKLYPESRDEINEIITQIQRIMHYMDVQYGIDNPIFLDMKKDREYLLKAILPWMVKYALTSPRITALNVPVENFMQRYTQNQSLLDIIMQHFFHETPAFFALSYLKLFLEYHYPRGGTGKFIEKLLSYIESQHGMINTGTEIISIEPDKHTVVDTQGRTYEYGRLIWSADLKSLYRHINLDDIRDDRTKNAVIDRRDLIADKTGNDSVFTLYLGLDLDQSYFAGIASEHFFYTPVRTGLSAAGPMPIKGNWQTTKNWLEKFFALTTYEISIPVLRDKALAPPGKTGLIISTLFDYKITKYIEEQGWYKAFTSLAETCIIDALSNSIYPEIRKTILHKFTSSPLTIAKIAGTTEGAITGWSFTNTPIPAESRIPRILNAIKTPLPGVYQAGQWTYSPSGFPISILTGKLAADQVIKELAKDLKARKK
jgi:phytoene dehydrogenase-like protein